MTKRKKIFTLEMIAPSTILLMALTVFPLIFIIYYSFTDYYFLNKAGAQFIGIENFKNIINDTYFRQALYNTVKFTILAVVSEVTIGLIMALFINSLNKGKKTVRTLVLLPTLLPPVTVALVWQIMFSNNYGIINDLLSRFGISSVNWLMDVKTAFYAILIIDIWQYSPFVFLLIYAALQSVPKGQYEAAKIDGADSWHRFRYITIPNISKVIGMAVLLRTIDSVRLFDKVNILTKGGPANLTATITQYIYQYGVKGLKVGYGSASSLIMVMIVLILAIFHIRQISGKSNEEIKG